MDKQSMILQYQVQPQPEPPTKFLDAFQAELDALSYDPANPLTLQQQLHVSKLRRLLCKLVDAVVAA